MSREEEEENNGGDFADLPDFLCDNDEIDRMIEERAGAFNLTGTNIRNILYHVVLGVGGARDFWDPTEQDFHTPLEIPEPKTRAAKQKVLEQETGTQPSSSDPLLTIPEVRSPEHDQEEDEEEDQDYVPHHDTEGSDYSEDEQESLAPTTPKSIIMTPSSRRNKASECDSEPATPSVGLAKRTRSLFSLKDRDLLELESALPNDDEKDDDENGEKGKFVERARTLEEYIEVEEDPNNSVAEESEDNWDGLEEELGNEFDNLTDEESSQSSEEDAADDGTFGRFLKGIANPREEFPEDESLHDMLYMYREKLRFEPEEFRTDKDVRVTKKEIGEMMRDLELSHPDVNEQLNSRSRNCKLSSEVAQVVEGPLFTPHSIEILKEQLQMHLQLLVQHTVLAHDVESLAKNKDIARTRIEELEELSSLSSTEGFLQAMKGESEGPTSILKCLDIYPALKLADREKPVDDVSPTLPIPLKVAREVSHVKHIEPLPRNKYYLFNYQPFFQKFHHIRPTVNFICQTRIRPNANRCFTELEDNLLAHGLDAFRFVKEQKVVYEYIRDYFLPTKTAKQISIRVKNKTSSSAPYNVIKHWKDTSFIRYDTQYTTSKLMKSLSVPVTPRGDRPIAPAVKRENLDWLVALRDHRRKIQREYNKKRQKLQCNKEAVVAATKLATTDENHGFEIAFLLKAKEVLKNDYTTYFNVFKLLAEYNQLDEFDCEDVIRKMLKILNSYPDLSYEFLSIFSPLPDLPVEQLLETLSHVKTRLLMRNLERHFKNNPNQYKKIIKMILGANLNNPAATRDTLLSMLRGKPELSDQVAEFFDKCAIKPKANDFEYIDLTDKNAATSPNADGFEELSLLEKTSASTQKHNKLIESINKTVNDQRKQEQEDKVEKKRQEEETKRLLKLEKRKMPARNVVECGDMVLTWTREQDREILRACRTSRPRSKTFKALAKSFPHKSSLQVKDRFFTLMQLMKKAQQAAERKAKKSAKNLQESTPVKQGKESSVRPSGEVSKKARIMQDGQQAGPSTETKGT